MNNSLNSSSSSKCYCGRYITIGEEKMRIGLFEEYVCPECKYRNYNMRIHGSYLHPDEVEAYKRDFNLK